MKLIKKPFSINIDTLRAIIYLATSESMLDDIENGILKINDKRLINVLKRLFKIYKWIIFYKLNDKQRKRLIKLVKEFDKKKRFISECDEFETLLLAYCNFHLISEIFKTIPEIKMPCCFAMGLIKKYLVKHYHISKRPDLYKKIVHLTADILMGLEEEGFIKLDTWRAQ